MKKLLRSIAVAVLGVGLAAGVPASAHTGTIGTTGPSSLNQITFSDTHTAVVTSTNVLGVVNTTSQGATSGPANASTNTTVGNVGSGAASNNSATHTSAVQSNSNACGCPAVAASGGGPNSGSINLTGPNSTNQISFGGSSTVVVTSTNSANVTNVTSQGATSGAANANNNTTVGNVTSGGASNTSTTTTSVSQSN